MRKIPTLFKREFADHRVVSITPEITEGCEDAFINGIATVKFDGSCCAIINGELYKRYDLKPGRKLPENAIPCQEQADPITGHFPHWVKCDENNSSDKHFFEALKYNQTYLVVGPLPDATYEAIGKHFNGNPYDLDNDMLVRHGMSEIKLSRDFDSVRSFLKSTAIEGIVFWLDDKPVCKIKRSDFGFDWPISKETRAENER